MVDKILCCAATMTVLGIVFLVVGIYKSQDWRMKDEEKTEKSSINFTDNVDSHLHSGI